MDQYIVTLLKNNENKKIKIFLIFQMNFFIKI